MDLETAQRLERLEAQVAMLYRKIYREVTHVGLKQAKDYVDSLDPGHRRRR